jgi:hypothetical protein
MGYQAMKYVLYSLFLLTLVPSCSKDDNGNSPGFKLRDSDNLDEMDYRLYSQVLKEMFPDAENLVVSQEVRSGGPFNNSSYVRSLKEQYPAIDTMVFWDPVFEKDSVYYLENKFSVTSKKVYLISAEEIQSIFSNSEINGGWAEFYRRYPNSSGTISFSRIGYNADKTQAMVNMGNMYASLGGEGHLIFLKLENHKWKIALALPTWIS